MYIVHIYHENVGAAPRDMRRVRDVVYIRLAS